MGKRGITLVELMISMVILVVAALGVMGVFVWIAKSIQHSKSRGLATNLSQEQLQILKQKNYYRVLVTTGVAYRTEFDPPIAYDNGYFTPESILEGGIRFTRLTYVQWATEDSGTVIPLPPTSSDTNMKLVTVSTIWQVDGDYHKVQIKNVLSNPDAVVASCILKGTVTNSSGGAAVPNAVITVAENTGSVDSTDSAGKYTISLFPGGYNLSCAAQGFFTKTAAVTVATGSTTTQDFALTAMTSATVSGYAWINDHLVVSQVVGSTISSTGFDQEYVEIFNPTTWTWTVAGQLGIKFQRRTALDPSPVNVAINYTGSPAGIVPGGYYLFANTSTITIGGSTVAASAVWENAPGGPNETNFSPRFVTTAGSEDYNVITVNEDAIASAAGGVILYDAVSGATIDAVGWKGDGGLAPGAAVYETNPIVQFTGLERNEFFYRYASTGGAHASLGPAYDSNNNPAEWSLTTAGTLPRNHLSTSVIAAGTPAVGAAVSCNDGLSTADQAVASGSPPMALFSIPGVATGTWTVFVSSGDKASEIGGVVVPSAAPVWIPNAATVPAWPGRYEVFLSSSTEDGYVAGSVKNAASAAISPAIVVSNGSRTTTASTTNGFYMLKCQASIFALWANPNNANVNYVSASTPSITVNVGQVTSNVNFVLSQSGQISGFVSRDGINPLPGISVTATNAGGFVESQQVSGPDGKYRMINVTTGTYTIEPVLTSGESATPTSVSANVTVGSQVWVGTFTVTGAMGAIRGSVSRSGQPIKTGAMIIVTTTTISGAPPSLSVASLTGVPYYAAASNEDGTYSLEVRGSTSTSYRVYGYYTEPAGSGFTFFSHVVSGVSVTPGATTTGVDFSW